MNDFQFDVTLFGAVGDDSTLNTQSIQAAIDAAAAKQGGGVFMPPGVYITGTIELKSGVTLELHSAAILKGSPHLQDYREADWGHNKDRTSWHLLVAKDAHNVTIRGGTIDGNGPAFWEAVVGSDPITAVVAREPDSTKAGLKWIMADNNKRPSPMIDLVDCREVRIENLRITNSAGWNLHLHCCDYVWLRGINLICNLRGPNNDGFDITGCRDVMVSDCHLSCCDDAIVIKTTPDSRSAERITVTNCIMRTPCAALKIGAGETFFDFRQITFSNCVVYESNRAIALYSLEGAIVEDIVISNIVCDTRNPFLFNRPIHMDVRSRHAHSKLGKIRNITISNVTCRTDGRIVLTAEQPGGLEHIILRDIQMVYPTVDDPSLAADPKFGGGQFSNKSLDCRSACAVVAAENVDNLVIENLIVCWPTEPASNDWRPELKAANGTDRIFARREFNNDAVPAFNVLWGRGLRGGYMNARLAKSSTNSVHKAVLEDSSFAIIDDH